MKRTLAGFAVALVLLVAVAATFDAAAIGALLADADLAVFALGPPLVLASLLCWSESQRHLLVASGRTLGGAAAARAYVVGVFGKQALPMGHAAGTAVMTYAVERADPAGYDRTLAVVAVADFLSLAASVLVAAAGLGYLLVVAPPSATVRALQAGVLVAVAGLLALVTGFCYRRAAVTHGVRGVVRLVRRTAGRLSSTVDRALAPERVDAGLRRFYETFDAVTGNRRAVAEAFALVLVGWLVFSLPLYTSALAVGVRLPLSLTLFLVPAAGVATAVPLPGGLGGFELVLGALLVGLTAVSVPAAAAVVLLYRLCSFWFTLLVGGVAIAAGADGLADLSPRARAGGR